MVFLFGILVAVAAVAALKYADVNKQLAQLAVAGGLLIAFSQGVRVIPAGHVGVVDFFGSVSEKTLKSGINFANPLARVIKFSVKTQELKETMEVPSKEGLTVMLEISALYHLDPEKAAAIYKTVGRDYMEILLEPQLRSVARSVTASYDARSLYTSQREILAKAIMEEIKLIVGPRGIVVEATPMRSVRLPPKVTESIEEKLRADQESQRMEFVLTKEKQEAERKRIEAQGISDFQTIVSRGISDQLLRWKGIEATEKIANSQNSKIIIVGGKDGMPLIMNAQ